MSENDRLKALIPKDALRVRVRGSDGKDKFRYIADILDDDVILTNKAGYPVVTRKENHIEKPDPADQEIEERLRRKRRTITQDPILKSATNKPEDPDVLQQIILALGEEAASLKFERAEAERGGQDTSGISTRRVNTLKALGDTWLKRKDQIIARGIDLGSPAFKALMKFTVETFQQALVSAGERPEMVEAVFTRLAKMMGDEWASEARERMKVVI